MPSSHSARPPASASYRTVAPFPADHWTNASVRSCRVRAKLETSLVTSPTPGRARIWENPSGPRTAGRDSARRVSAVGGLRSLSRARVAAPQQDQPERPEPGSRRAPRQTERSIPRPAAPRITPRSPRSRAGKAVICQTTSNLAVRPDLRAKVPRWGYTPCRIRAQNDRIRS